MHPGSPGTAARLRRIKPACGRTHTRAKQEADRSLPACVWPSGPCKATRPLQGLLPPYGRLPRSAPPLETFLRSFLFSDLCLCGEPSLFVRPAFLGENGFLMGKRSLCGRSVLLQGSPSLWETRLFKRAIPCKDPIPFLGSLVPLEGIHPFAENHFFRGKHSLCRGPSL